MYSAVMTGAVHGISSYLLRVETNISNGLPAFNMVGFMSGEVREAGERVRVALKNTGIPLPAVGSADHREPGSGGHSQAGDRDRPARSSGRTDLYGDAAAGGF